MVGGPIRACRRPGFCRGNVGERLEGVVGVAMARVRGGMDCERGRLERARVPQEHAAVSPVPFEHAAVPLGPKCRAIVSYSYRRVLKARLW